MNTADSFCAPLEVAPILPLEALACKQRTVDGNPNHVLTGCRKTAPEAVSRRCAAFV